MHFPDIASTAVLLYYHIFLYYSMALNFNLLQPEASVRPGRGKVAVGLCAFPRVDRIAGLDGALGALMRV